MEPRLEVLGMSTLLLFAVTLLCYISCVDIAGRKTNLRGMWPAVVNCSQWSNFMLLNILHRQGHSGWWFY